MRALAQLVPQKAHEDLKGPLERVVIVNNQIGILPIRVDIALESREYMVLIPIQHIFEWIVALLLIATNAPNDLEILLGVYIKFQVHDIGNAGKVKDK